MQSGRSVANGVARSPTTRATCTSRRGRALPGERTGSYRRGRGVIGSRVALPDRLALQSRWLLSGLKFAAPRGHRREGIDVLAPSSYCVAVVTWLVKALSGPVTGAGKTMVIQELEARRIEACAHRALASALARQFPEDTLDELDRRADHLGTLLWLPTAPPLSEAAAQAGKSTWERLRAGVMDRFAERVIRGQPIFDNRKAPRRGRTFPILGSTPKHRAC